MRKKKFINMRVLGKYIGLFSLLLILSACSSKEDLTDYIELKYYGIDTRGTASYVIDEEAIVKNIFDIDVNSVEPGSISSETIAEVNDLSKSFEINLDKKENLSNGDKITVTVTVDPEMTKRLKEKSERVFEVSGLPEGTKITAADLEKNVIVTFKGANGKGIVSNIDKTFESDLSFLNFEVENDGELKNGEQAKISLTQETIERLNDSDFILDGDGSFTVEITGLINYAQSANEITNLDDIKRMLSEGINRKYKNSSEQYSWGRVYEINLEGIFYRQFEKKVDEGFSWQSNLGDSNGNLVGVYSVKEFSGGTEGKLNKKFTIVYGFSNLVLDENNKVNLTELIEISKGYDDTYSLESVLKLMEGYNYMEFK
ncbi:hypothetical protein P9B03_02335 [Metasolibacillus meyeri]|uniref:Uncharacterized protein n=1 Tax=Metasolibacillus meyeri TaxID=1071052 RepID=A0AAW9NPW5_9BACL|nr:hypothetical protein [Metasolibacillus meyeri]MEC1177309.1 hypothetical protein [Metasolibacillus meyeri]